MIICSPGRDAALGPIFVARLHDTNRSPGFVSCRRLLSQAWSVVALLTVC